MATLLLIRHGNHDFVNRRIVSWMPGVHINEEGREEAERLGEALAGAGISAIYSSPLERTLETAAPIAQRLDLAVRTNDAFGEIRVGDWTDVAIEDLDRDPRWRDFNRFRSGVRPPGGEMMIEVQARMVAGIERVRAEHSGQVVAIVSHGDPIKAAVMHYLAMPLDMLHRFEIAPASVSVVEVRDWGPKVWCVNAVARRGAIPGVTC
jgi:probable phosphoglycerate mutase